MNTRTIRSILSANPKARVIGISRSTARASTVNLGPLLLDTELQYHEHWNAWYVRPKNGAYQQICIFLPQETK